jgi:hypothetical protein
VTETPEEAKDDEETEHEKKARDEEAWETPPPSPTMHTAPSSRSLSVSRDDPSEAQDTNTKRLYSERITNTPPASPQKKWTHVQATSSIRNALEIANDDTYGSPKGLLHFWKKGSQAEVKEFWDHKRESRRAAEDDDAHSITVKKSKSTTNKRDAAKLRKQRQRQHEKEAEIRAGVRSPGGTKRKVSAKIDT